DLRRGGSADRGRGRGRGPRRRGGGLVVPLGVVLADVQVEERPGGVFQPAERAGEAGHVILRGLAARQFAERDLDVAVLAVATDGYGDLVAGLGGGQGLGQRGGVGGLCPGDRVDHVAGAKPGPFGPSTAGHGDHAYAACGAVRAEDGRDLGPDRGPVRVGDV